LAREKAVQRKHGIVRARFRSKSGVRAGSERPNGAHCVLYDFIKKIKKELIFREKKMLHVLALEPGGVDSLVRLEERGDVGRAGFVAPRARVPVLVVLVRPQNLVEDAVHQIFLLAALLRPQEIQRGLVGRLGFRHDLLQLVRDGLFGFQKAGEIVGGVHFFWIFKSFGVCSSLFL